MNNIDLLLTPAMEAYLIALIYRNTRSSCLSLAALCSWLSHDSLNPLLHSQFHCSRRLWARIKSNRLLDGEQIGKKWAYRFGQAEGHLKKVDHLVRVIKDGRRFWVTNDVEINASEVKKHCRRREQIEEAFRLLKQEFGWGGSSERKAKAQEAHQHLGLKAMCLAQHAAHKRKKSVNAFKRDLFREPIPDHLPFWQDFLAAA